MESWRMKIGKFCFLNVHEEGGVLSSRNKIRLHRCEDVEWRMQQR